MRIEPLLLLGGQVAVGLDLGGVVDLVLAVGIRTSSPVADASRSGAKLTFVPKRPVLMAAHSGSPLARSR